MTAAFLDDAARAAFEQAIVAIERASAVEVVVAVRRRSAAYLHANVVVGGLAAFAGLAAMLFGDHVFGLVSILVDPFVLGIALGAAVELLPGAKRLLTPAAFRRRAVERAARATFVERGVHATRDRSGLLVYVSWLERQIVLIGDTAVDGARSVDGAARGLADDARRRAEDALTAAFPGGGAAVARALADLADVLARAVPRRRDDVNELADAIDSDHDRAGERPRATPWR